MATMPGPYKATKLKDFLNENKWLEECEAFVVLGVSKDSDDPNGAKLNVANSEVSRELLSLMGISIMYHHNLKTDSQEIMLVSKDGS